MIQGTKGAKTAIFAAGHELAYNETLHNGVKFGFAAAMVVNWEAAKYTATDILVASTNYIIPYSD